MTMRYSHLSDAYLREAVNRVNLGPEVSKRWHLFGTGSQWERKSVASPTGFEPVLPT